MSTVTHSECRVFIPSPVAILDCGANEASCLPSRAAGRSFGHKVSQDVLAAIYAQTLMPQQAFGRAQVTRLGAGRLDKQLLQHHSGINHPELENMCARRSDGESG